MSSDMLPAFRVRRVLPLDSMGLPTAFSYIKEDASHIARPRDAKQDDVNRYADGYVRMRKEEYEELLRTKPKAALRYLDEDDGEVILVGSGLELEQRLQEPLKSSKGHSANLWIKSGVGSKQRAFHSFTVEREPDIIKIWSGLHQNNPIPDDSSYYAPGRDNVSFGQTSPLTRNAPKGLIPQSRDNVHARRWASYSNLPVSFASPRPDLSSLEADNDTATAEVTRSTEARRESSPEEVRWATYLLGAKGSGREGAKTTVFSSTMQVPTNQKQEKEYKPLLELFETRLAELASPTASVVPLAEIGAEGNTSESSQSSTGSKLARTELGKPTGLDSESSTVASAILNKDLISTSTRVAPEAFAVISKSLLSGFEDLAAAYKPTLLGFQEKIVNAHQNFLADLNLPSKVIAPSMESMFGNSRLPELTLDIGKPTSAQNLDTTKIIATSSDLPKPSNDESSPQRLALLEHVASQEERFCRQIQQQKENFAAFLVDERASFVAHLDAQTKSFEVFLNGQKHPQNNSKVHQDEPQASLWTNSPRLNESVTKTCQREKMPSQPSSQNTSFQSLSDSVLDAFYVNEYLKETPEKPTVTVETDPYTISTNLDVISKEAAVISEQPRSEQHDPNIAGDVQLASSLLAKLIPEWKSREVERLLARRVIHYDGSSAVAFEQFLVRWVGCGPEQDTWCDRESIKVDSNILSEYEENHARGKKFDPLSFDSAKGDMSRELLIASRLHSHPTATTFNGVVDCVNISEDKEGFQSRKANSFSFDVSEAKTEAALLDLNEIPSQDRQRSESKRVDNAFPKLERQNMPLLQAISQTETMEYLNSSHDAVKQAPTRDGESQSLRRTAEDKEEQAAWGSLAQYFLHQSSTGTKATSQIPPHDMQQSIRHHQADRNTKPFYELSSAPVPQTNSALDMWSTDPMVRRKYWNSLRSVKTQSIQSVEVQLGGKEALPPNFFNLDAVPGVNKVDAPLPSLPVEKELSKAVTEPTLWQAMCLSDPYLIRRTPQTDFDLTQSSTLSPPPNAQCPEEGTAPKETRNKPSSDFDTASLKNRESFAPSVPKKPVRLQRIPANQPRMMEPPFNFIDLDPKTTAKATPSSRMSADSLSKMMDKDNFSLLGTSLLDDKDLDATLDSLLFPQTVQGSQAANKRGLSRSTSMNTVREKQWKPETATNGASTALRNPTDTPAPPLPLKPTRIGPSPLATSTLAKPPAPAPRVPPPPPKPRSSTLPRLAPTASSSSHKFSAATTPAQRVCASQLIEMGFPPDKAEMVAVSVGGNLGMAIEMFEEDQRLWRSKMKGKGKVDGRGTDEVVPGGWDEELYG